MKTYGFNLLPQKSRALSKKEEKRDNYSLSIAVLPFISVIMWLLAVLANNLLIESYKTSWQNSVNYKQKIINEDLAPVLIQHGELVTKTNALSGLIENDINPERLFLLLDQIYQQDDTFSINGYGRNQDGSFFVNIKAYDYRRLAEVARKFSNYKYIENVSINNSSYEVLENRVTGVISFLFNYSDLQELGNEQQ